MVNRMNRGRMVGGSQCSNAPTPSCSISGTGKQSGSYSSLLKELQATDFAIVDTVLYLDAYPKCAKALEYYKKLVQKRAMLVSQIEASGLPLTAYGNKGDTWTWNSGPMPWEYEANV